MPKYYQIPTHLQVADKIEIPLLGWKVGLTIRQGLICLLGWSLAIDTWKRLTFLGADSTGGEIIHLTLPILLAIITFIFATCEIAGRHLEVWAAILFNYVRRPRVYIWKPVVLPSVESAQSEEQARLAFSAHEPDKTQEEV